MIASDILPDVLTAYRNPIICNEAIDFPSEIWSSADKSLGELELPKSEFHAFVSRGSHAGEILFPHQHEDGSYVVSMTRFESDYVRLTNVSEILAWLEKGYGLRMSNPEKGITAASLIMPDSIYRLVTISKK